jgi:transcriptional regulator with XRE-family HTH domain
MKPHSPRDKAFMKAFARKLRQRRDKAKHSEGVSYEEFAKRLGLTRAGVLKYLNEENVPSPQMLEKIHSVWGVQVGYGELDITLIKERAKRNKKSAEAQMLLPFAIENLSDENIVVELAQKKPSSIELNLRILFKRAN